MWKQGACKSSFLVLSVSTYIFPDVVVKLVENNFLVFNIVVSKDDMSLWARRVHISRVSEDPRGKWQGEGRAERRTKWWHQGSSTRRGQHCGNGIKAQMLGAHRS